MRTGPTCAAGAGRATERTPGAVPGFGGRRPPPGCRAARSADGKRRARGAAGATTQGGTGGHAARDGRPPGGIRLRLEESPRTGRFAEISAICIREHAKLWGRLPSSHSALVSPPTSAVTPPSDAVSRAVRTGGLPDPGTSPPRFRMLSQAHAVGRQAPQRAAPAGWARAGRRRGRGCPGAGPLAGAEVGHEHMDLPVIVLHGSADWAH
jgi:hypothetical protein